MADEIEFVNGLIVKEPHENAPDYVKANISIKVADLGQWLREQYKAGNEWVNVDVKESRGGKWYASVSTFKPKEREQEKPAAKKSSAADMDSDIPF